MHDQHDDGPGPLTDQGAEAYPMFAEPESAPLSPAEREHERLVAYLLHRWSHEIRPNESATDVAIRLLDTRVADTSSLEPYAQTIGEAQAMLDRELVQLRSAQELALGWQRQLNQYDLDRQAQREAATVRLQEGGWTRSSARDQWHTDPQAAAWLATVEDAKIAAQHAQDVVRYAALRCRRAQTTYDLMVQEGAR